MRTSSFASVLLSLVSLAALTAACGGSVSADCPPSGSPPTSPDAGGPQNGEHPTQNGEQQPPGTPRDNSGGTCSLPVDVAHCGEATHVATAGEALAYFARANAWQHVNRDWGLASPLAVSGDVVADVALDLEASQVTAPICGGNSSPTLVTCSAPLFRVQSRNEAIARGVTCTAPVPSSNGVGDAVPPCSAIHIAAGTRFRVRGVVDFYSINEDGQSRAEIVAPCTDLCSGDQVRCAASQTCFGAGADTARYCEARPINAYACLTECGALPDGTDCTYAFASDHSGPGACRAGACVERGD